MELREPFSFFENFFPFMEFHQNKMSSDDDFTELFDELSIAHGFDLESIEEVLKNHGINDPSKSLIKKLLANIESKKCCSCHFVGADRNELVLHLKGKGHMYGQDKYAQDKREFIDRVKNTLGDETLPDVDLTSDSPKLTDEEKRAFASFNEDSRLNNALRSTYENLLYIGLCLIFLRDRKAGTPSKKTDAIAKRALIAHTSRQITP